MTELTEMLKRLKDPNRKPMLVTPRIEQWLAQHPEGIVPTPEIMARMTEIIAAPPTAGRGGRFHSNRGTCERAQVFTFLGMPERVRYSPEQQNLFNDGTWRHLRWQAMGLLAGVFTHVEVYRHEPKWQLGVRADAANFNEGFGVELKGTGNLGYVVQNGISEQHLLQIHTYFAVFPELNQWVYIAEDKRSLAWREIVIERNPRVVKAVENELADLNSYVRQKVLPPMLRPCKAQKGAEFDACPFSHICPSHEAWPTQKRVKLPQHRTQAPTKR